MIKNRVRELRKKHKLSLERLGELIELSHTQLGRIEKHEAGLSIDLAEKIAQVLDEEIIDVIGLGSGSGQNGGAPPVQTDAVPYSGGDDLNPQSIKRYPHLETWKMLRPVLVRAGVPDRAIAYVDPSEAAIANVKPLACVLAETGEPKTIIARQFVPPSLLITNSRAASEKNLDIELGEARIVGIIRGQFVSLDS